LLSDYVSIAESIIVCTIGNGHEVFSAVTGGRPLSFSRLICGGNPALCGEGARLPCRYVVEKTSPPEADKAGSLGTEEKTS